MSRISFTLTIVATESELYRVTCDRCEITDSFRPATPSQVLPHSKSYGPTPILIYKDRR
jgi:hypothetical protein